MSSRAAKDIRPDGIEILGSEGVAARMCCEQKFAQCRDKMCQWRRVTKAKVTVQSLARIKLSDVETLNDRLNVKYRGEFKTCKSRLGSERKCESQEIQKTRFEKPANNAGPRFRDRRVKGRRSLSHRRENRRWVVGKPGGFAVKNSVY